MIAVIFELQPSDGQKQAYFDTAAVLHPLLEDIDGFISVERFESLSIPGKFLSLSFWHNEEALRKWRNQTQHRGAQTNGRQNILADYRLRVAWVQRDYSLSERAEVPEDSARVHR